MTTTSSSFDPYTVLQIAPNSTFHDIKRRYRQLTFECHAARDQKRTNEIKRAYQLLKSRLSYQPQPQQQTRDHLSNSNYSQHPISTIFPPTFDDNISVLTQSTLPSKQPPQPQPLPPQQHHSSSLLSSPPPPAHPHPHPHPPLSIASTNAAAVSCVGGGSDVPTSSLTTIPEHFPKKVPNLNVTLYVSMDIVWSGGEVPLKIDREVIEGGVMTKEEETIYVNVPRGIDHHEIIRIPGKGNVVEGMEPGDLRVLVDVRNDTPFHREGLDLYYEHLIDLKDALCGTFFCFQHINGKTVNMKTFNMIVTPETRRVIPNMGLVRGNSCGSLILTFRLLFPSYLSEEQRRELERVLVVSSNAFTKEEK